MYSGETAGSQVRRVWPVANDGILKGSRMPRKTIRPICFVAMPFGKKAPPGLRGPVVDFDRIFSHIEKSATGVGMEVIRADFEPAGGFIHKPMYERLLVAEYVVADLTFANPNVMYEVGVRHGASDRATVLLCAEPFVSGLPFDFRPLRVLPYGLSSAGAIAPSAGKALAKTLAERLRQARAGNAPVDNPVIQVTGWKPSGALEHSKTDAFLERLQFTGEFGEKIQAALALPQESAAIRELERIEKEVVGLPSDVAEVHSALIGVFLGYREKKAYARMEALFRKFPKELQQTPMACEQRALALNRLAEEAAKNNHTDESDGFRKRALAALDAIQKTYVTGEAYGIRGRIYKGWYDAAAKGKRQEDKLVAAAMLDQAIATYESGFRADLRDYYPGVNALTLRVVRGKREDFQAVAQLAPVVRFAVDAAPAPKNDTERYWQRATKFEIACTNREWAVAAKDLKELLAIRAENWMRETTAKNLGLLGKALQRNAEATKKLKQYIAILNRAR